MELRYTVKTCRVIQVKYLSPTKYLGSRVKLSEDVPENFNWPKQQKTFSVDNNIDSVIEQALQILRRNGFHPVARGCIKGDKIDVIICDDFGDNYKYINELT